MALLTRRLTRLPGQAAPWRIAVLSALLATLLAVTAAAERPAWTCGPEHVAALTVLRPASAAAIVEASEAYGLDRRAMLALACCESRLDAAARGRSGEAGLFQFMPATWAWAARAAGLAGASRYDADANARAAAHVIRNGGSRHWRACWWAMRPWAVGPGDE